MGTFSASMNRRPKVRTKRFSRKRIVQPGETGSLSSPTLVELARQLGLSRSTVSRAFYDDARINSETRALVLDHASRIGYRPNPLARGLITRRTRIVGMIVSDITNPFYPEVLTKLTEKLQREGLNVMLLVFNPDRSEEDAVQTLLSYRIDLVVMLATTLTSAGARACQRAGTPVVLFNRHGSDENMYAITCDNERGGRAVADFLIDNGHRRLGFVAGNPDASTNSERRKGFITRCNQRGAESIIESQGTAFSYEAGYTAARSLLSAPDRPTAIFCANDILAIGAFDVARREFKLTIPQDLSIVGFDDIALASWPSHSLTTVHQPITQMIELTLDIVRTLLRGETPAAGLVTVPGELIIRSTTNYVF
jgi:DNA-binding LacI/PurR family transcriptional regulator